MLFSKKFRIYYNYTDAEGVVYHANYLIFYEQTRTEFLEQNNIKQSYLQKENGILFVVLNANISYLYPARLDDEISVSVEKIICKDPKIIMEQNIYLGGKIISKLNIELVIVNNNFKLCRRIPENLKNKLCLEN